MKSRIQLSILAGLSTISLTLFALTADERTVQAGSSSRVWFASDPPQALQALLSAQSFTPGDSTAIQGSRGALVLKAKKSNESDAKKKGVPDKFALELEKPDGKKKRKYLGADALYKKAGKLEKKKKSGGDSKLTKTYSGKASSKSSKKFSVKVNKKSGKVTDFKVKTR